MLKVLAVTSKLGQLNHLAEHHGIIGGDMAVVKAARALQGQLFVPLECLEKLQNEPSDGSW